MGESHNKSRKWLTFNTGAFGISSIYMGWSAIKAVFAIITGGVLTGLFTSIGFWSLLVFLLISLPNFRGAWKAFGNMDYGKAQQKGLISWASVVGMIILDFMI